MRLLSPCRSQIKCCADRFEQQLMIRRYRQELDCALSDRLNPKTGASIAYKKNDRNIALLRLKPCLQFQTRRSGNSPAPSIQSIDSRRAASVVSDGRSTDSNESGSLRAARISTE